MSGRAGFVVPRGPRIGVLAIQGNVREHQRLLEELGARVTPVRRAEQLADVDALVLPGGESSTIDRLTRALGLRDPLVMRIGAGMPVLGTCAGLILLADRLVDPIAGQRTLGGLDVTVRRNAFGPQAESFETELVVPELGTDPVRAAFIRAPVIEECGPGASTLAALPDGRIVAAEQGSIIGCAFHPEQTGEERLHRRFLERARAG
ncbi:MAG: pyridoxal 5'-phosphate synthase glutaminase subunit PdxT [Microbacterium sp.]